MENNNDSVTALPQAELLKFLALQARHYESMLFEQKTQITMKKSYAAAVEEACVACSRGSHPLASCSKFQGLSREERWETIKKYARCKNCLKSQGTSQTSVVHLPCAKGVTNTTTHYCITRLTRKENMRHPVSHLDLRARIGSRVHWTPALVVRRNIHKLLLKKSTKQARIWRTAPTEENQQLEYLNNWNI